MQENKGNVLWENSTAPNPIEPRAPPNPRVDK